MYTHSEGNWMATLKKEETGHLKMQKQWKKTTPEEERLLRFQRGI
jgi:hypothetical protein